MCKCKVFFCHTNADVWFVEAVGFFSFFTTKDLCWGTALKALKSAENEFVVAIVGFNGSRKMYSNMRCNILGSCCSSVGG